MKRLLLFLYTLIVVFVLAIIMVLLIGYSQPIPEHITLIHLGDICNLPCWIGIIPGKTHVAEARRIIANIYNDGNSLVFDNLHGATTITNPDGTHLSIALNDRYPGGFPEDSKRVVNTIDL